MEQAKYGEWKSIETAPTGDDDFYLVWGARDGKRESPFVVRGSILKSARLPNTPGHLHLHYLTHWMPLPELPPKQTVPVEDRHRDEWPVNS